MGITIKTIKSIAKMIYKILCTDLVKLHLSKSLFTTFPVIKHIKTIAEITARYLIIKINKFICLPHPIFYRRCLCHSPEIIHFIIFIS